MRAGRLSGSWLPNTTEAAEAAITLSTVFVRYEAAVGGGVPLIKILRNARHRLQHITKLEDILNSTTICILSKVRQRVVAVFPPPY